MQLSNSTLVTALFDLGRGKLSGDFKRPFDQYLESFETLLQVDMPMVIFCDAAVEAFVWEHREPHNTKTILTSVDDLKQIPFYDTIQKIRTDEKWYTQAGWLEESTQAKMELYNPLVMSKQFWLNDASLYNHFDTKYFFWVDAGIANTVSPGYFTEPQFERKLTEDVKNNKMLYVAFPYDGQVEVHGFKKSAMNSYAGQDTEYVVRGGFFGGTRDAINKVNGVYYYTLADTLSAGYMGTEESVFTIISYTHPQYFNLRMIDANGLLFKYFEDVKSRPDRTSADLALYFLTYNSPEQLRKCMESLKSAAPETFNSAAKYVINNSTDTQYAKEYEALATEFGLEQHNYNNVGITGGRSKAAQHFHTTDHQYMVFFEDDMLLNGEDKANTLCKAGFKCHDPDLLDKAIVILEENELDYLKLTFSEFFGDNHKNWAWHNMSEKDRKEHLDHPDVPETKVRTFYTGCYNTLSYSVGEHFYCNWPLLFSKAGNEKVFMRNGGTNPTESFLMARTQERIRAGEVKTGCLLASPITHKRFKHYPKKDRREN